MMEVWGELVSLPILQQSFVRMLLRKIKLLPKIQQYEIYSTLAVIEVVRGVSQRRRRLLLPWIVLIQLQLKTVATDKKR